MFRALCFVVAAILLPLAACAHEMKVKKAYHGPIIDVHLHALPADSNGPPPRYICPGETFNFRYDGLEPWPMVFGAHGKNPQCDDPIISAMTDEQVMDETIAEMKRLNIRGVLSGTPEAVSIWREAAPDLFIAGRSLNILGEKISPEALADEFDNGGFEVLAEVTNQYAGVLVDDPRFEPFWALAEEKGFPVGVHVGHGPPGTAKLVPSFRVQGPQQMETVLAKHPDLRVYLMHAGYPFVDQLKAMLYIYPQLYIDVGVLQVAMPRAEYNVFLFEMVRAGFSDRVMFGSDQMVWPGLIEEGVDAINEAPGLSYDDKKAILYDNAVRFLRLTEE